MIKKKWTLLFLVSWLLFGAVFLFRLFSSLEMPAIDMVSINRIEKETAAQWERGFLSLRLHGRRPLGSHSAKDLCRRP